ncbi:MAG: prepilin-type N-terminal cleavage/methylation domain-containing protein [Clostridiales Family XIII bacterium]|jgi:type IV pilus assembly protein PilA|nr:prepilin-type N-terminal cleavage/methylation domain-containing protein [Clostridiales Family XIII bacterium]
MKMILKQQLKKNQKKGFTLIEVIVVLVILAILAAIAIPALTGYIDEANERAIVSEGHTVLVGLQAVVSGAYGDGGSTQVDAQFDEPLAAADGNFLKAGTGLGLEKFKKLTDDSTVLSNDTPAANAAAAPWVGNIKGGSNKITGFTYINKAGKQLVYNSTIAKKWTVTTAF